jgi:hypothetical protein
VPSELTTLNRVQPGLDIDTLEAHLFAALAPGGVPQAPGALLDLQQIEDRARDFGRESWILHRQPPGRKTKPEAPDAAAFRAARGTS